MINPKDVNHVVVAVIGHLYTENDERGIFVTYDGGENWEKSLFVNNNTGAIDLISDPKDFNCLLYTSPSPRDATLSRMPSSA